jgi:hypothetical protein
MILRKANQITRMPLPKTFKVRIPSNNPKRAKAAVIQTLRLSHLKKKKKMNLMKKINIRGFLSHHQG